MKILHTADWHLGRTLYRRQRYAEFEAFLNWLIKTIEREQVEVLLVAGDIFDTTAPSNRAQELYYRFLCRVANSCCRHVVITGGNHDSPSFLAAPRELLKALNVYVIGSISDNIEDEVIVLNREDGSPEAIICAVPYLRDRDIRQAEAGESIDDKVRKLIEGITDHYSRVVDFAEGRRRQYGGEIPLIAMGHLFTAGGRTVEGDGVRDLYVGSLAYVAAKSFPENIDYLALGHLHVPQKINNSEMMRYCGSPLPMGFGEAGQKKSVCILESSGRSLKVKLEPVPAFQPLQSIRGNWNDIHHEVQRLVEAGSRAWVEIVYEGRELISDLRERLDAAVSGSELEILRVKNNRILDRVLQASHDQENLPELNPEQVFTRCLSIHEVPEDQKPELYQSYREILSAIHEEDKKAE